MTIIVCCDRCCWISLPQRCMPSLPGPSSQPQRTGRIWRSRRKQSRGAMSHPRSVFQSRSASRTSGSTMMCPFSDVMASLSPLQPSWFVQSLLFQLCVQVNRVGGHALPRPTLQELLHTCLNQVLHHYQTLTQQAPSRVTQAHTHTHTQ